MGVYLWTDEWLPGENTVAYYPFTSNADDQSGNGYNGTNQGCTFSSDGVYIDGLGRIDLPSMTIGQNFTINLYIKPSIVWTANQSIYVYGDWSYNYRNLSFGCNASSITAYTGNNSTSQDTWAVSQSLGTQWNNVVLTKNGTSLVLYRNGTQIGTHTTSYNVSIPGGSQTVIIGQPSYSSVEYIGPAYVKDYIIEKSVWGADEVSNYYNTTKSKYGIS